MPVSAGKIVTQANIKILARGQDPIDAARLTGVVDSFATVYSVADLASLPPAVDNPGRFIYVTSINDYRYSDGANWVRQYSSVLSENQLWAWGYNGSGRLGDGTASNKCSPVREISSSTDWCQVSAGGYHTAAIKTSGQLWLWGPNGCGRLGDGTTVNKCSPVREISSSTDWCQVSAGYTRTSAVKTSGQIWSWGRNVCGDLGDGTTVSKCSPVREISSSTDWCQVSTGYRHSSAINTAGQLWSWGTGAVGALGDGTTAPKCSPVREICSATDWCQVSAGAAHTAAIKTSGQLWTWGCAAAGRLGDGTTTSKCSPVREISSSTDWRRVSIGSSHTAAVKTSGQLWAWGNAVCGRLGDGTTTDKCSPVREILSSTDWCQVSGGSVQTAAIKTSGQIWSWGYAGGGRLGDGTTADKCSPVREISSSTDWCQVSTGRAHSAAIKISRGFNEP